MHICKYLVSRRKTVLVLTRGYGGPQDTAIITDPADERLHRLSDEVRLMASNLNATIAIGADRMSAFNAAAKTGVSDVVILDDGFQHWQIHRDLDIVVLDATAPFGSEFMLPSGNLREPRTSIARSNFIILTKTDLSEDLPGELARVNHISGDKPIVLSGYQIDSISTLQPGQSLRITDLSHSRLLAFAAIANPRSFFNLLAKCGIPAAHTLSYRDHHIYTQPDVDHILATARAAKCDGLVATEKDAVKLVELDFGGMPVYVIRIRLQITDGLGNLHSLIDGVIDGKP
jgi:tetraacyldisaccharide 4'-kinase